MTEVKQVEKQQREQQEVERNAELDLNFEKMLLAITKAFSNSDNKKDKLLLLLILNSLEKHSVFDNEQPRPLTYARERLLHDIGYEIYELAYCLSVSILHRSDDDDKRANTEYKKGKLTVNY